MKAKLKFNLDDQDDAQAHLRCVKALDLCKVLFDFDNYLREKYKYEKLKYCQAIREELYRQMELRGIDLDELIS